MSEAVSARWRAIAALLALAVVSLASGACASRSGLAPTITADSPGIVIERSPARKDGDPWLVAIAVEHHLLVLAVPAQSWVELTPGTPVTLSPGPGPDLFVIRRGHPPQQPEKKSTAAAAPPPGSEGERS